MKGFILALVLAAAFYIGALIIGPFAHAVSIELALRHILYLGQYQQVFGQALTAIPLALISIWVLLLAKVQQAALYTLVGASLAVAAGLVVGPGWPSNHVIYIVGELAFVLAAGATAWGATRAMATRKAAAQLP